MVAVTTLSTEVFKDITYGGFELVDGDPHLPIMAAPSDVNDRVSIDRLSVGIETAEGTVHLISGVAELVIDELTAASPTVVQTTAVHGLTTGDLIFISRTNTTVPVPPGYYPVTVTDTTHFTIAHDATGGAGTAGNIVSQVTCLHGSMNLFPGVSGAALYSPNCVFLAPAGRAVFIVTEAAGSVCAGAFIAHVINL